MWSGDTLFVQKHNFMPAKLYYERARELFPKTTLKKVGRKFGLSSKNTKKRLGAQDFCTILYSPDMLS